MAMDRRSEFWYFVLVSYAFAFPLALLASVGGRYIGPFALFLLGAYNLALMVPSLAVSVRRLHDTGRSGLWVLVTLVPLLGTLLFISMAVEDSQPQPNRFGPMPADDPDHQPPPKRIREEWSGEISPHAAGELANLGVRGKLIEQLSHRSRERRIEAMASIAASAGAEAPEVLRAAIAAWDPADRTKLVDELAASEIADTAALLQMLTADHNPAVAQRAQRRLASSRLSSDAQADGPEPVNEATAALPVVADASAPPSALDRPAVTFGGVRAVLLGARSAHSETAESKDLRDVRTIDRATVTHGGSREVLPDAQPRLELGGDQRYEVRGAVPRTGAATGEPRPQRRGRWKLTGAVGLVIAAGLVAAVALNYNLGRQDEPPLSPAAMQLAQYLSDVSLVVQGQSEVTREYFPAPDNRQLFGPTIVFHRDREGRHVWSLDRELVRKQADWFLETARRLTSIRPPATIEEAHHMLVMAYSLEAQRLADYVKVVPQLKRADYSVTVEGGEAIVQWNPRQDWVEWNERSMSQYESQLGCLDVWVSDVTRAVVREGIDWPRGSGAPGYSGLAWFVDKVRAMCHGPIEPG